MKTLQHTIAVAFSHRVFFTEHLFSPDNPLLAGVLSESAPKPVPKVVVVVDEGLATAQPQLAGQIERYFEPLRDRVQLAAPPVVVEGGERLKNSYFHVSEIQSEIDRHGIDRHSFLIAVGGGALLDVAGLAAATAHRGVRHVRVPTTTLSQADSGVGVKNGINAFGKKNFIGAFAVPFSVINDFAMLDSLPDREKRGGYSEAVKVACIRDALFFERLEAEAGKLAAFDPEAMRRLIHRSAELHVNHIATAGDPFELGSARPLDFGHWAAHKLEHLSDYRIRHGEAVAIGVALDVLCSRLLGKLAEADAERVLGLLEALGFELFANELLNTDSAGNLLVVRGLDEFRVHLGGELTLTLLEGIGHGVEVHELSRFVVAKAIHLLEQRHARQQPVRLDGYHPAG